ncbi:general transcription factor II-I repeat domain-containing protein 2-like [Penaeus chinensis]|uniref:general transcription factor II-I repeat domain-containing protein 2-like n=1 Tax=Penaeus chinensis TaxID=139456 RepID=UPI001FB5D85E|nr:general transcription factor II-I repeat domain-containing protein 2-like [Penaeus chinensis]
MNELNIKLQGKDQCVHDMYTNVRAFKTKLALFSKQMSNTSFAPFPTLATLKEAPRHVKKYRKSLNDLHGEFCRRLSDFGKIDKSLQLVSCPFTQDPETVPGELQLELIDLQCDAVMKEKFNSLRAAKFPNIQKMAQRMLVLFASTYVCELLV